MRKIALVVFGIIIVVSFPALASAQAMFGNLFPGPGAPPSAMTPPGFPGGCGAAPPNGCPPKIFGPLSFYAGYLFSDKKGFKYTREPQPDSEEPELVHEFPIEGVLLATSGAFPLSDNFGIIASGGLLIPTKTHGTFSEDGPVEIPLTSRLEADNQWGFLDAGAFFTFQDAGWACFQVLGGFRWDHFTSRQSISSRDAAGQGTFTGVDKNDFTVDAYIPYFGGQLVQAAPGSRFVVRAIGFPTLPGDLSFQTSAGGTRQGQTFQTGGSFKHPLKSGFFIETYAEYTLRLLGDISVGGFGVYNIIRANTGYDFFVELGQEAQSEQFKFTRRSWTFGGVLSYSFSACL